MTDSQASIDSRGDNFLAAGFRELGRTFNRFVLRQKMRRHGLDLAVALAAIGQRAWEEQIDLSAFADLRDRLTGLDTRAGELSQTTSKLEAEQAALELERRTELETFAARRRGIEEKKNPIDAALRALRARTAACDQTIAQADSRLAAIAGTLTTLDGELASLAGLATPDQPQRLAAAQEQRSRLASEQSGLGEKLAAARVELPGLAAEGHRLAGESQQHAAEIATVNAEQRATIARIDGDVKQVRSESQGASQQTTAVKKERLECVGSLGQGLFDSGMTPPALAEQAERVAAIDRARTETEAALGNSLADTQSLPRGTMLKFWSVLVGVPLLLVVAGMGTASYLARRAVPTEMAAPAVRAGSEDEKNLIIQRFVQSPEQADQELRKGVVRILKEDILTIGATADPTQLPILTRMLHSAEPELRSAAAEAIGMTRPTQAETPELARLLNDPDARVAAAARRALAESADQAARDLARNDRSASTGRK